MGRIIKEARFSQPQLRGNYEKHPFRVMIYGIMISVCILFTMLTVAYIFTRVNSNMPSFSLPKTFYVSTIMLLLSSACLFVTKSKFENDDAQGFKLFYILAFALGILFVVGQVIGWIEMNNNGLSLLQNNGVSYIYLLSGTHVVHVIVGILLLLYGLMLSIRKLNDPAISLVFFTDPARKFKLKMVSFYWHAMSAIWLLLLLFFSIFH